MSSFIDRERKGRARRRQIRLILFALPLAACGASSSSGDLGGAPPRDLAIANDLTSPAGPDMAVSTGGGMVMGTFGGSPFGSVMSAWTIGNPDSSSTTVVYLFNKAVQCHDAKIQFGQMGWDANLPDQTRFLEMKLFGATPATTPATMPGDYKVTKSMTPAHGEASANYSLSKAGGASAETSAASGTVTLKTIVDPASATGQFTLTFGADTLTGSFTAGFCDVGVEP